MRVAGPIFCLLWYWSIVCGFLSLCCPAVLLLFISNRAFRHTMDLIFATWELYSVGLLAAFGVETVVVGDSIRPWERSVIIMNHRTRLDWNFIWACMHHATRPPAHRLKFILKAPIRHVPGPGWVMQLAGFFYIHRQWGRDRLILTEMLNYYKELDHTYQILIFPEGTDLTPDSLARSNKYAEKEGLPRFSRVLHPRTTGFAFLASHMKALGQLDAVYDITVGYAPGFPHTELDLLSGKFPSSVHFYIHRYGAEELGDGEETLAQWLKDIWISKEELLEQFHLTGTFVPRTTPPQADRRRPTENALHLAVVVWIVLTLGTTWLLIFNKTFCTYAVTVSSIAVALSLIGASRIELAIFAFKKAVFSTFFRKSIKQ